jgi:hypothetical protein
LRVTSTTSARKTAAALAAGGIIALSLSAAPTASAIGLTCDWTGAGGDGLWSNAANWANCADAAPGEADVLRFGAAGTPGATTNDLPAVTLESIEFVTAGYSVGGAQLRTNGLTVHGATTFEVNVVLPVAAAEKVYDIAAPLSVPIPWSIEFDQEPATTATLQLSGGAVLDARLTGSGERLRVTGDGIVQGGLLYPGAVELSGTAHVRCGGADCGGAAGDMTIVDAAGLEFTADTEFQRALHLGPGTGYAVDAAGHAVDLQGAVDLAGAASVRGGTDAEPMLFTGGVAIDEFELTIHAAAAVPLFAELTSFLDGTLRIGSDGVPGSIRIEEGQLNHNGRTTASGEGSLIVADDAFALGPNPAPGGTLIEGGAVLGTNSVITLAEAVEATGGSTIAALTSGASLTLVAAQFAGGVEIETRAPASSLVIQDLTGLDDSTVTLTGAGADAPIFFGEDGTSAYTGTTVATAGAVQLDRDLAIPGDFRIVDAAVTTAHTLPDDLHDQIADTSAVTIDGGAGLLVINDNERIGSLAGPTGRVHIVDVDSGLTIAGSSSTVYDGDLLGDGQLVHEGSGTLQLGGTWTQSAVDSRLAVEAGTVIANGWMPFTETTVIGTLGGTGTLSAIILDGGTIPPGTSPGCLSSEGEVSGSGTFAIEIGGAEPCSASDRVSALSQALDEVEWSVALTDGFQPAVGDEFVVLTTTGGGDPLPTSQTTANGTTFDVVWDGSDVILRVVAVPGQVAPGNPPAGQAGGTGVLAASGADPASALWPALAAASLIALGAFVAVRSRRAS